MQLHSSFFAKLNYWHSLKKLSGFCGLAKQFLYAFTFSQCSCFNITCQFIGLKYTTLFNCNLITQILLMSHICSDLFEASTIYSNIATVFIFNVINCSYLFQSQLSAQSVKTNFAIFGNQAFKYNLQALCNSKRTTRLQN